MTYPRAHLVDSQSPCFYHVVSRCVRRAWLCGEDPESGRSYEHRRQWIERRILDLAEIFAVDIYAYAVMNNHYHIVLYFDPVASKAWSDRDVADRWLKLCPPRKDMRDTSADRLVQIERLLGDKPRLEIYRARLASLSWYMRFVNHPIACLANREDSCTGHFWEGRFKSAILLDEAAVVACMAYVDLNPIRARIARRLEDCDHTSVKWRLIHGQRNSALAPIRSGRAIAENSLGPNLGGYRDILRSIEFQESRGPPTMDRWWRRVAFMRHRQRVYGSRHNILRWLLRSGQRATRAIPMPV